MESLIVNPAVEADGVGGKGRTSWAPAGCAIAAPSAKPRAAIMVLVFRSEDGVSHLQPRSRGGRGGWEGQDFLGPCRLRDCRAQRETEGSYYGFGLHCICMFALRLIGLFASLLGRLIVGSDPMCMR